MKDRKENKNYLLLYFIWNYMIFNNILNFVKYNRFYLLLFIMDVRDKMIIFEILILEKLNFLVVVVNDDIVIFDFLNMYYILIGMFLNDFSLSKLEWKISKMLFFKYVW